MPEAGLVALTGASGGLGRVLVRRLLAAGKPVRALVRDSAAAEELTRAGADVVLGDLRDAHSLERLVDGARVVHHLAAWMGRPAGLAELVNVTGTRTVVTAAAAAGVERVVMASSVAVYGPVLAGEITEEAPLRKVGDAYSDSKADAERAAFAAAAGSATEVVALRPTMIYGPASSSWTLTPLASVKRSLPVVIGDGSGLLDAVYVEDVARAFELAAEAQGVGGRAFNVVGVPVTVAEFMGCYGRMVGRRIRKVPLGLARVGARAAAMVTGALPGVDRLEPAMVEVMSSQARFSGAAAADALEYSPEVDLHEGMRRTARWLRDEGHLFGPQVALVVGAGRGLGRAVAARLAQAYVTTYAGDIDPSSLTASESLLPLALDATSEPALAAAVAHIEAAEGRLDAVVTTVGQLRAGALEAQPLAAIAQQFELNALLPLKVARAVAPGMRRRGHGRIVNVSSTNGFQVTPFMGAYSAAKFALEGLTDSLRQELAPHGVDVVLVQPAAMSTAFASEARAALLRDAEASQAPWDEELRALHESSLWGLSGAADPDDVARSIVRELLAPRPHARVASSLSVPAVKLFALLPDRLKDAYFSRSLRSARRRRPSSQEPRERDNSTQAHTGPSK